MEPLKTRLYDLC